MSEPKPSKCRSCSEDVHWAIWRDSDKWMPVDAVPDMRPPPPQGKGGNLVLFLRHGQLLIELYSPAVHDVKRNRYTSHFATCPNADEHRRKP